MKRKRNIIGGQNEKIRTKWENKEKKKSVKKKIETKMLDTEIIKKWKNLNKK